MATEKNLNGTSPAAPAGARNATWQVSATASGVDADTGQSYFDGSCYLPDMVGDSGSGGQDGLVPAPAAGDAAAGKFLAAGGTWKVPSFDSVVGLSIDGGGSVIATGQVKRTVQVPFAGTIVGWAITADQSGSISADVWKVASSAPPSAPVIPTAANKISASAPVALSGAQSAAGGSSAVSTWTTAVAAWDVIGFDVTAAATITAVTIEIFILRS